MSLSQRVTAQADVALAFCANAKALASQNTALTVEVARLKQQLALQANTLRAEAARVAAENEQLTRKVLSLQQTQSKYDALKRRLERVMRNRGASGQSGASTDDGGPIAVSLAEADNDAECAGHSPEHALADGRAAATAAAAMDEADVQTGVLAFFDEVVLDLYDNCIGGGESNVLLEPVPASSAVTRRSVPPSGAQKRIGGPTSLPHVQVVRRKADRAQLPARTCAACEAFYRATGLSAAGACGDCGRHRSLHEFPETPPGFWDPEFPETMTQANSAML
ncbi:hypothetical protein KFE25_008263 [Diacronema lutheri]|uniref:DNA endonuclease activator Ctp1 C-terminal domain-containing protein n=1 Tax=Diacronema lutheri TaxID=2081491 RepID=A0A8J6CBT7_DIALT|nr:hypothetical protein KFE25_008263 [Diacronema lutheri]